MFKFRLDSAETFLIFAPRGADLGLYAQIGMLALLLLVPLGLILWLCRYELCLVSRRQASGLLLLRSLMVFTLWLVIGLQPHWASITTEETPGRVRIAVDLSSSMDVGDVQRRPAEKLRLARVLKLSNDFAPPSDVILNDWIRQYEFGKTALQWITPSESVADSEERKRIGTERKNWHDQTMIAVDALTRKAIIARILSPDGLNLLERMASRHQVEIVGFDQQAEEMLPAQLMEKITAAVANSETRATDLGLPLKHISPGDQPLLGVVLFSDGQHNAGKPPYDLAGELGKQQIPIFPVVIGVREPPNDLMILDVKADSRVFKDATIPIEIRCKITNLPAHAFTVEMQFEGKPVRPDHRKVRQHHGKDDIYSVIFQAKMEEVGTHTLAIRAKTKDQKEITLANNQATRVIRVSEEKARVLLIDGEARWEYHYLAGALARDPTLQLERVVFSQPRIGMVKEPDLEKLGVPRTKLPEPNADAKEIDPLMNYDCILLGDVSEEQMPLADRRRLEHYVAHRGGTLIMVAGKRYLPSIPGREASAIPNAFDKENDDPLAKMLPITEARLLQNDTGFTLRLTDEGKRRPFLHLEPDQPGSAWPDLPKHYWGVVGKRKPAATVLLTAVLDSKNPAAVSEKDSGIVLQQNYGVGRVLFVGLDSTWRWRYRVGDLYHHRFWGQLVRWSASDKLLPTGNSFVRYGPRQPVFSDGKEVELAVRIHEDLPSLKEMNQAKVNLHRQNPDGTEALAAIVPLAKNPRQPQLLEANLRELPGVPDLPAGTYRMELDIPLYRDQIGPPSKQKDSLFRILPREERELLDLATNVPLLQTLADASDGKLFTPDSVEELLERLSRRIRRTEHRQDSKPWQDEPMVWWLLGLLLSLFTLEWGWRKWLDLP